MKKLTKSQQKTWDILSTDIQHVDFKEFRNTYEHMWLTKERELMWVEDMETNHIISCVNMLERCDQTSTRAYNGLCNELNRRYSDERWQYEN
jgi:hypothetical protein